MLSIWLSAVVVAICRTPTIASDDVGPAELNDKVDFVRDIKPIFQKRCHSCHGKQAQGGLRLTSRVDALKGGDRGPTFVPGNSTVSLIVDAVTEKDPKALVMPPTGNKRLSVTEVRLLRAWIDQGAVWSTDDNSDLDKQTNTDHWAFRSIVRPEIPHVKRRNWTNNAIDHFVLGQLENKRVKPSRPASRATLIRRLSLDLTGLPPSPTVVTAFINNSHPDAYGQIVDHLLSSTAYGERWGRHWLDVARYADSAGHEMDERRPIWKYRDWVIRSLNHDLPFDEFTIEQLAGDLLPNAKRAQRVATGFNRNNMGNGPEGIVDRSNTVGRVFLGLTVGCAQCHSHKFDPISQNEYYQFFAFFNNSDDPLLEFATDAQLAARNEIRHQINKAKKTLEDHGTVLAENIEFWESNLTVEDRTLLDPSVRMILDIPRADRTPPQTATLLQTFQNTHVSYRRLKDAYDAIVSKEPQFDATLVVNEREQPRETTIFIRGDFQSRGDKVEPGVPQVLPPLDAAASRSGTSDGKRRLTRLDLARWLVRPDHPLTARVTVNRVWQHYFGTGLVETEDDFGTQGKPPTHPRLLDWLASEFMSSEWSLKRLHRLIVTSATYQQSSQFRPDLVEIDPRNFLIARAPRLRLEAETIRDQALAVSGLLNRRMGGPGVFPYQSDGVMDGRADKSQWIMSQGMDLYRRGTYIHFWRLTPHPFLKVFDVPDAVESCTRRTRSNTAIQALAILNHPWFVDCARAMADRLLRTTVLGNDERIEFAFRLCLVREPTASEVTALKTLLDQEFADFETTDSETQHDRELAAWTAVSRTLLNLDEFITRE
ncbi:MAG: PSD1 and planctomycete cytochrome C domain-containing protein [Fuerstiella sp.]|nr:PSD1 and planctomycete cytochrome C domain-containing protein [Fuerstiella sp.]